MTQQTFPRGNGPLVSVLLPTRGRPTLLARSIDSLVSLAHDQKCIEFLIKIDDDDTPTHDYLRKLQKILPIRVRTSTRGNGYADLHLWFNSLAMEATGDWLLVWNDDAVMKTEKWDMLLDDAIMNPAYWHGVTEICCLFPNVEDSPGATPFFFLRRTVVEILGRFSAIPHCDTWVTTLMRSVESIFFAEQILVAHAQSDDNILADGVAVRNYTGYTIHSKGGNAAKLRDALKLQEYIDSHRETL